MANYSLILDTKFKPFSYAEMLAPVAAATQAHQAIEEEYGKLAAKANVWEEMANEQTDSYAYKMYKTYSDDLKARAEQLMKYGLNASSRRGMLDMRARYSKEIVPIEAAYKRREELAAELRKALVADPTLRYLRMADTMSLDDFIKNPALDYGKSYSGALLAKLVSLIASNYAKVLVEEGGLESLGLTGQYKSRLRKGASPEEILAVIEDAALNGHQGAIKFLKGTRDQVMKSSGVADWADYTTLKEFTNFANQGLYSALGQTEIKNYTDRSNTGTAAASASSNGIPRGITRGNIPIDIHHLVSPNQLGEQGALMVERLRAKLGLAKTYDGKTAKWAATVNLKALKVGDSDVYTYTFKNSSGGTTVKVLNNKGELLNRNSVVNQGKTDADKAALGRWYDSMYLTLTTNFRPNKNGRWTASSILSLMNDINSGRGALTMGAMKINFGADNNKKALEALLPEMTFGDETHIYEILGFDKNGNITKGKRASSKDFVNNEGNAISTPMYYAAPNANTEGLIMHFNGKTYLIPRDKLGSLGEHVYNIDIPKLLNANKLKQDLIAKYGELAYYNSEEGQQIEQIIDNYGAAYLRAAGTTLGYSYELPKFGIRANNQTEI